MNIINSSLIDITTKETSFNKRGDQKVLLDKNVKSIRNVPIDLHPKGIGNGYVKYQAFSREVINNEKANMGYISNFRGTGEEALLIHGTKKGKVALYSHAIEKRREFSVKEAISYIKNKHNIDLRAEGRGKLHIMSCFGVSNGVYQAFANELGRKVIGYGDGYVISTSAQLNHHFREETSKIRSVIGDVVKDKPENLRFIPASVHKYIPFISKK